MAHNSHAVVFECGSQSLIGIVHGAGCGATGVLVIVGGPQYRVGSHRQFLLLARYLAANNIPVMRFDYRGMGDAEGEIRTFEGVSDDIRAAVDAFIENSHELQSVVLWGLCDAASAALFYAHTDPRVKGLVLLNPWVRTESGEAKAHLRHYYIQRVLNKKFWQKLFSGSFDFSASLQSLCTSLKALRGKRVFKDEDVNSPEAQSDQSCQLVPLPDRMLASLNGFNGKICFILSGDDLTAAEFRDLIGSSKDWKKTLKRKAATYKIINNANHTFSRKIWRDQVEQYTLEFLIDD